MIRNQLTPLGTSIIVVTILIVGLVLITTGIFTNTSSQQTPLSLPAPVIKPPPKKVTLGFVGDIMVHTPMSSSARQPDGTYDFAGMFADTATLTQQPDLMIGNIETPVDHASPLSGYPNFNAPIEILDTLAKSGFDMLQTTNNHTLDQGVSGAENTLQNIFNHNMVPVGGSKSIEQTYQPNLQSINGITVGFIAATFGFNGYSLPTEKTHIANKINIAMIKQSVANARAQGADIVIVLPHFGTEYERTPNEDQKNLVQSLVELEVDAIIGTHPHVIQPIELVESPNGKMILVAYSLGNFVSNQQDIYTDIGMLIELTYEKSSDNEAIIALSPKVTPLYTHKYTDSVGKKYFKVVKLDEVSALPFLTPTDLYRIEQYKKDFINIPIQIRKRLPIIESSIPQDTN